MIFHYLALPTYYHGTLLKICCIHNNGNFVVPAPAKVFYQCSTRLMNQIVRGILVHEESKLSEKNPLCFAILGILDLTRALWSSPILTKKILENLWKKSFFLYEDKFFLLQKLEIFKYKKKLQTKSAILLVLPIEENSLHPEVSSPESRGGSPERYTWKDERMNG